MSTDSSTAFSSHVPQDCAPDTDPQSPFWQDAPSVWLTANSYGEEVPDHRTQVLSRWTSKNLYFLFVCPYRELHLKLNPIFDAKTDGLWNWDVAEVFIGAALEPFHRYKEFEMSPRGEWLDLDVDAQIPGLVANPSWSSGFSVAARVETAQNVWYGCMRIPYSEIDAEPATAGHTLRVNFFRSQGPQPLELAWRAPQQASFHAPEKFGILKLV